MRTERHPTPGALLLAALLVTGTARADESRAGEPASRKTGDVVLEAASMTPPGGDRVDFEWGTLYVPENRSEPGSRLIGVGFARFRATRPTSAPPVFYLPGGPGQSYLTNVSRSYRGFEPYRAAADVVVFDQRGFSPRGEILSFKHHSAGAPLDRPADLDRHTADFVEMARGAVAECASRRVDLRGYTILECADDVNDLRKALDYERITLVATSFGSQWSFAVMRRHPGVVARALLSGVEPLDYGYDMPSHVFAAVQRKWWEAEKDAGLKPFLPPGGLAAAAREVLMRLDREPARVRIKDEKAGEDVTVVLGRQDFQRDFLFQSEPAALLALYHGHLESWARVVLARRRARDVTTVLLGPVLDTSLGVTPRRRFLLRTDPGAEFLGHWNFDEYLATADIWPTADVGDEFRTERVCTIPVVFAQGDWDTSTPVENLLAVVPYFTQARILVAEHGGHGVLGPIARSLPEVNRTLVEFVRSGDASGVPPRAVLPVPKFSVPDFAPPGPAATPAGG